MAAVIRNYGTIEAVIRYLEPKLSLFAARNDTNLAVVFDIDDCLLTWKDASSVERLHAGRAVYEWVKNKFPFVHIFMLTGREDKGDSRQVTIKQLKELGYDDYDELWLMSPEESKTALWTGDDIVALGVAISRYKWTKRMYIQHVLRRRIMFSIGDMWQDLVLGGTFIHYDIHHSPEETSLSDVRAFYVIQYPPPEPALYSIKLPALDR